MVMMPTPTDASSDSCEPPSGQSEASVPAWQENEAPPTLAADESVPGVLEPHAVEHLVVHCSATPDDVDIGAREIHAMHLGFGWHGIGYHRIIRRDGRVEAGRPDCWIGAHVLGHNQTSLGVCLIGRAQFTEAQFEALYAQLRAWQAKCPQAIIRGHCDFAYTGKTCPNFDVSAWCEQRGLQMRLDERVVPSRT